VKRLCGTLLALFALAAFEIPAHAQSATGVVTASANLQPPPVVGGGVQNLDFGNLLPGATGDVPPGPAGGGTSSAGWLFSSVRKGNTISWAFTLPAVLTRGSDALPVNWNNAGYGTACVSNGGGCIVSYTFNPAANGATWTVTIPNNTPGNNYDVMVYAGARTTVPSIPPGIYSAQVVLTMTYLN
jgi:hypothetical protein